ncbi:MAG TPA: RHS repeat-associated core domain-containing protein, partial [Solirubrobacterales bacterium]|nr:RHS repeat-associated core domain-containing protein [Solirubrobacterales bacterium]
GQVVGTGTAETTFHAYDGAGIRLRKVTDRRAAAGAGKRRSERIYLGQLEIYREYGGDGTAVELERQTLLAHAHSAVLARIETRTTGRDAASPRQLAYQHPNRSSSVTLELDQEAAVVSYEEYFPYGGTAYQAVRSQTEVPRRRRHAGKERDEESGLYYYGARYYAPWLGRWLSVDPEGLKDGPNPYLYVHANPIAFVDPTGTAGLLAAGTAGALLAVTMVVATGLFIASPTFRRHAETMVKGIRERMPRITAPHVDPAPSPPADRPVAPPYSPAPAPPLAPPVAPPQAPPAPPLAPPVAPPTTPQAPPVPVAPPQAPPVAPPLAPPTAPSRPRARETPRTKPTTTTDALPDVRTEPRRRRTGPLRYVTYTKRNLSTGQIYVGRTSGYGTPAQIVADRERRHHVKGWTAARVDRHLLATQSKERQAFDPAYWAIRGREQQLIDRLGGAHSDLAPGQTTRAGNPIRGVRKWNPMGPVYHAAASAAFGQVAPYTGYYRLPKP